MGLGPEEEDNIATAGRDPRRLDGCSPAAQPGSPPEPRARAVQVRVFVVGKDTRHHICSLFPEGSEKDQCDGYIYTEGKKK